MKKNKAFKLGDRIFTTKNSAWGLLPMTIIKVFNDGVNAEHKEFTSNGWFSMNEIEPWTKQRQIKVDKLILLKKLADDFERELFSKRT